MITGCQKSISRQELDSVTFKVEVMTEVRQLLALHGVSVQSVEQSRAQLKSEIEEEVLRKLQMLAPESELAKAAPKLPQEKAVSGATGIAKGQILRDGKGLPDCHVKLVRLVKAQTMAGLLKISKEGIEFETVTDQDGKYRFDPIPVGSYKLKWQLPDDTGWIRRLRDKPDVDVEAGTTKVLKTIETGRGLAPS